MNYRTPSYFYGFRTQHGDYDAIITRLKNNQYGNPRYEIWIINTFLFGCPIYKRRITSYETPHEICEKCVCDYEKELTASEVL